LTRSAPATSEGIVRERDDVAPVRLALEVDDLAAGDLEVAEYDPRLVGTGDASAALGHC
jgi:hypothetical protein